MGKKKATGMSKRLGFTDRATIAENKDILRYNERLEREAKGLPPEEPRGRSGGRGPRRESGDRPDRPPRRERPVRPPALDEEQLTTLRTAYQEVVGESGLEPAAEKVLERLTAHDGFERASMAGWELAGGGHADERTPEQWELLRGAWLRVRLAMLEAYATIKPEAADALAREKKQQARLAKPPRPRRRPGTEKGERPERRPRREKKAEAPKVPSPSAIMRMAAANHPADAPAAEVPVDLPAESSAAPSSDAAVPTGDAVQVVEPGVPAEVLESAAPGEDVDVVAASETVDVLTSGDVLTGDSEPVTPSLTEPVADLAEIETTPETTAALTAEVESALADQATEPDPAEADDLSASGSAGAPLHADSSAAESAALAEPAEGAESGSSGDPSAPEPTETADDGEATTDPVEEVAAVEPEPAADPIADTPAAEGADPALDGEVPVVPEEVVADDTAPPAADEVVATEVEAAEVGAAAPAAPAGEVAVPEHEPYAAPDDEDEDDAQLGLF